jgi:outer membrane protein TolC
MPLVGRLTTLGRSGLLLAALCVVVAPSGCCHRRQCCRTDFGKRVLPPPDSNALDANLSETSPPAIPTPPTEKQANPYELRAVSFNDAAASTTPSVPVAIRLPEVPEEVALPPMPGAAQPIGQPANLSLPAAIDEAFRRQPRLRVYIETVEQARRTEDIAFVPFMPLAAASYSVGGYSLGVEGRTNPLGSVPGFTFLPSLGSLPIGLNLNSEYQLADIKMQWLICDFGRRLGTYRQAGLASDIAALQCQRAYQTVANEVAVAYYQVLRARALKSAARDAVRRASEDLEVAKNLAKGGVFEQEKVLRAQVLLAENERLLDAAEDAEVVAAAGLNMAIGYNVNAPTPIAERAEILPFGATLVDCLQTAVAQRREFSVARQTVQAAMEGQRVARADFAPKISADGALIDFREASPVARADLAVGFIKLEWGVFEGGKRVAEIRISDSKLRSAMAQADSIADTIAFQVTEAYRHLLTARRGIERSRPAVEQAEENHRLVKARATVGDATPAEITDAESALTRAQVDYLNSIHDYLISLARLEYAMGVTPVPGH